MTATQQLLASWATMFAFGYLLGLWTRPIINFVRHVYMHLRHGICFWFDGTGYLEWRDGTHSEFCRRCGHPHGYHNWGRKKT